MSCRWAWKYKTAKESKIQTYTEVLGCLIKQPKRKKKISKFEAWIRGTGECTAIAAGAEGVGEFWQTCFLFGFSLIWFCIICQSLFDQLEIFHKLTGSWSLERSHDGQTFGHTGQSISGLSKKIPSFYEYIPRWSTWTGYSRHRAWKWNCWATMSRTWWIKDQWLKIAWFSPSLSKIGSCDYHKISKKQLMLRTLYIEALRLPTSVKDFTTLGEGNGKRWPHNGLESLPPLRRYVQVEYDCFYNLYLYLIHYTYTL